MHKMLFSAATKRAHAFNSFITEPSMHWCNLPGDINDIHNRKKQ